MDTISAWLREFRTIRLTCRGCGKVTCLGLDAMLDMSRQNDDLLFWRERFKCSACGAKAPYLATRNTHMTPPPKNRHPF